MKLVFTTFGTLLLLLYLAVCGFIYSGREEMCYAGTKIVIADSAEMSFVRVADVQKALAQAANVKGKWLHEVNTYELGRLIETKNPLVRHAYCYHTPDSMLRIDIEQRRPIMRVKSSSDGDFYIDTDGATMPTRQGIALHLPLVTGHVRRDQVNELGLYEFAQFLQNNRFWRQEITQIHVGNHGEVSLVPRVGSHTILMGSLSGHKKKLDRLMTFYQKVMPQKGWNAYDVINVKFEGQVIGERAE